MLRSLVGSEMCIRDSLQGDKMFADALSRPPQPLCPISPQSGHSFTFPELIKAQSSDPMLSSLSKTDPLPSPLVSSRHGICHKDGRLFIPASFVKNILFTCHDKAGHFSAPYVQRTIARSCFWPSMTKDIANYIASCNICARVNPASPKTLAPLQPIKPVAKVFGDRLHLDLVDMPRSAAGNVAICTIVDAATGFVIVVACPDKTHAGVINALRCHVFPHYGCPRLLVSCLLYTSPSPRDS